MRISDWSSDVCSSDLYRCRTAGVTSAAASASRAAIMTISNRFDDVQAEWELLDDWEDRYRLLIDLGRALEPMPDALKTDATLVRGRSEEHTSEIQSLMSISYAVFSLKKKRQ